ncbi:heme exporter protein CcmD [Nevskia ramosa]
MNEKHAVFIWSSYALSAVVLLWNWLAPRFKRNELRRRLSEDMAEQDQSE